MERIFSSEFVKHKNVLQCSNEYDCLLANKINAQKCARIVADNLEQMKTRDYFVEHTEFLGFRKNR